ncbi:MAG: hypothetical protein NTV22_10405 [bacterium]|nr:hypothetical protein [bacterium]
MQLRDMLLIAGCLGALRAAAAHEILWGDLHAHSTYSYDAVQYEHCTLLPAQALSTCIARLDFVALTDHAENEAPGYCSGEKWTNTLQQATTITTNCPFERAWSSPIWIEPGMVPEPFCVGMGAVWLAILYRRARSIFTMNTTTFT